MSTRSIVGVGIAAGLLLSSSAFASLIKTAGKATTSNKSTTTTTGGQKQILNTIDPYGTLEFQLSVQFEADKVSFQSIQGLNGYVVDSYNLNINGNVGIVDSIFGYWEPFVTFSGGGTNGVNPPLGEIDIFQIVFNDNAPTLNKTFTTFAGPTDYLTGFDPQTQDIVTIVGPFNPQTDTGIEPSSSTVLGVGNGSPVPLPPGLWMGLVAGAGAVFTALRRRAV